jgi:hypothetical protein
MSRIRNYTLSTEGRENETDNIQTILYNDGYYQITINMNKEEENKKKWSTFMYMGK